MTTHQQQLETGLNTMGITFTHDQISQLLTYLTLLEKWNKHINLSGHRDIGTMIPYHILDSLSILPYLKGPHIIDVGTGAGLPGIPLAIMAPQHQYVLLDSRGKRMQFVKTACREISLSNSTIVAARMEEYQPPQPFQTVMARAVSCATTLMTQTKHLLDNNGQWLFMKGQNPEQEMSEQAGKYKIIPLTVPKIIGERHLLIVNAI